MTRKGSTRNIETHFFFVCCGGEIFDSLFQILVHPGGKMFSFFKSGCLVLCFPFPEKSKGNVLESRNLLFWESILSCPCTCVVLYMYSTFAFGIKGLSSFLPHVHCMWRIAPFQTSKCCGIAVQKACNYAVYS